MTYERASYGNGPVHRTAQAVVADRLRREILTGRLEPGTRLLQAEVAERMQTSTTPVREAMRELAGEGLLHLDPHRGVIVHEPTAQELEEVYQLRMLLEEASITKTVEHITEEELEEAERFLGRMEAEEDPTAWAALNRDFHALLAGASRSPILTSILSNLRNRSAIYVVISLQEAPERTRDGNREHRELVEACRDRDPERAVAIVHDHLESTLELGESYLARRSEATAR